ncbi:MAG: phage holin family protein [Bacteroidetes bacterium]|nr:MAG: phage holin family protein [Bacteroidota bacterium]
MNIFVKAFIFIVAVFITNFLVVGVAFKSYEAGFIVAASMALINVFIKPIIRALSFPVTLMTLGTFPFFINTFLVMFLSFLIDGFVIFGDLLFQMIWATAFALILTIVTVVLEQVTGYDLPGGN